MSSQNITSLHVAFPTQVVLPATIEPAWRGSKARILHLINGEHYSGAERVQDLLALRLPEFDYRVGFACLKPAQFPVARISHGTPLYYVPMRSRADLSMLAPLRNILERDRYGLLHAHTPRAALIGSLLSRATGLPLVYHVHSPVGRDSTRRVQNWVNQQTERLSLRTARRMITVSHSLAAYMQAEGYDANRISVVPNGVPVTQLRRSDRVPGPVWTLGTVALFRQRKGTEVLLDAIARLRQRGWDVRLRAVGGFETDAYRLQLQDRAAALQISDAVIWTGFTKQVNAELTRMDLFVLPSLFGEGLPMVVLEAMAAGVPTVASRVEGVPEAIRDAQDGLLAEPGNPQDLADAIERVMDGQVDWSRLRANAIARHADCFSDRAMAHGVAAAYDQLLIPA